MSLDLQDEKINVDEIFRKVGSFGRYQLSQAIQICCGYAPAAFNTLGFIFIISNVPMQCQPMGNESLANITMPTNSQIVYKQCDIEIHSNESVVAHLPCDNGYLYPKGRHMSLKSEWDLVCDRENLADVIISAYNVGKLIGCYILPPFADKYGRKPLYLITHALMSAVNIANTFSPSYLFYLGSKAVAGFLESGMDVSGTIMLTELFPAENRTLLMIIGGISWSLAVMLLPLVAYIMEPFGWRYLNAIIGIMSFYTIFQIWIYNESLRWLLDTGKWDRADTLIKKICRTNKVDYHTIEPLLKYRYKLGKKDKEMTEENADEKQNMTLISLKNSVNAEQKEPQQKKTKQIPGVIYILLKPALRRILLVCMYFWFVSALVYYGLYLTLSSLSGNKFINFFLNALMEFAAQICTMKLIIRWGRKKSCAVFQTMAGVSVITAVILKHFSDGNYGMQVGYTICSLLGMFAISSAFLCVWLYTPEMFPTDVRNVGMATSSTAARIASMLAPFSNTLARYVPWGPGVIFGCFCLFCNVLITLLPETAHRQLPQTAKDVEEWRKKGREKKKNKSKKTKSIKVSDKEVREEENTHELFFKLTYPDQLRAIFSYEMSLDLQDEKTNVDEIFRKVGRFGRYQMSQAIQVYCGYAPVVFNILGIIFIISNVPMQCRPMRNESLANITMPTNSQIVYKQCDIEIHSNESVVAHLPCDNGYLYPKGRHTSLKSEWDLVCDRENLADVIISAYNVGKLIGCYILPPFADKYGRKPIYIITHALMSAVNIANTFSPSYLVYLGSKAVAGFLQSGMGVSGTIMLTELFPAENRTLLMIIGGIAWSLAVMLLPLVAYIMEPFGWRYLNAIIGIISFYSIFQIWIYNESLRWLLDTGKWDRADALIKKICRTNKVDYHTIEPLLKYRYKLGKKDKEMTEENADEEQNMTLISLKNSVNAEQKEPQQKKTKQIPGVIYILLKPALRRILLVCMYFWFVSALVYYGLYLTLSSLSGNKFINFFLNALMEFAAQICSMKLIIRWGRKKSCAVFQTMAGVSIITAVILKHFSDGNYGMQVGYTICSLLGMFAISASFLCIWLYTPEMFPTDIRNVGMATSSTAARIASMLAPFSNTLARYVPWGPGVIFGCFCLFCNVLITLLPETAHRQLPQTAKDVEEWRKKGRGKKKNKSKKTKSIKVSDKEVREEENIHELL